MRTNYPTFGKITYKDDNIDVKLTIKGKKVEFNNYECENCKIASSLKNWCSDFVHQKKRENEEVKHWTRYDKETIPEEMLINNKIVCHYCHKPLIKAKKPKLKVYVNCKNEFVNLKEIIRRITLLGGVRLENNPFGPGNTVSCFHNYDPKDIEGVYENLSFCEKIVSMNFAKITESKFTPHKKKVTIKSLEESYNNYHKQKVIRKLVGEGDEKRW